MNIQNEMIKVQGITKSFGNLQVLKGIDLAIGRGEIVSIVGPSGAGKTTLLRIINRITASDAGRVLLNGKEITQDDVRLIGYMPEERGLYKNMKVGEQAIYFARLKGLSRPEAIRRLKEWFVRFGIESWWNKKVEELSKGMAQKMQFIVTILHEPELLIFDEPFSGFDPVNANLLKEEILRLRDKGATVIFSTHNMSSVEEICDHITLINKSRNILSGNVEEIRHSHGTNIFEIHYRGDSEKLTETMTGICTVMSNETSPIGINKAKIHIADDKEIRSVIAAVNDESNMVEKEHKIDLIRWEQAVNLAAQSYFDINAILSYLVRVNIVSRWAKLDEARGREMFKRIMAELDSKELVNK